MRYYDYDYDSDLPVVRALADVWDPPPWAEAYRPNGTGNCIEAAALAAATLRRLHVHCEIVGVRARGPRHFIGWGDCRSFMVPSEGMVGGHAIVAGYAWALDTAAQQLGADGPVVATPCLPDPSERTFAWSHESFTYTWAPGVLGNVWLGERWGYQTHTKRLARMVREIVGPRRAPRSYVAY